MKNNEICEWLRANSAGVYRPAAEAADRIEFLEKALSMIISIEKKTDGGDWDEIEEARRIAEITLFT